MASRIRLAGLLALAGSMSGCISIYHALAHHRTTVESVQVLEVPTRRISSQPLQGGETLKSELTRDADGQLAVSACLMGRELQVWERKVVRETVTRESCDGNTWDQVVVPLTLGLPIVFFEYLFVVPLVVDSMIVQGHRHAYTTVTAERADAGVQADPQEKIVDVPQEGIPLRLLLAQEGSRETVFARTTPRGGRALFPLFGRARAFLSDQPLQVRLQADVSPGESLEASVRLDDSEALRAALQGADWRVEKQSQEPTGAELHVSWVPVEGQELPALRLELSNPGPGSLFRVMARLSSENPALDGRSCRIGLLGAGKSVTLDLGIPVSPEALQRGRTARLRVTDHLPTLSIDQDLEIPSSD